MTDRERFIAALGLAADRENQVQSFLKEIAGIASRSALKAACEKMSKSGRQTFADIMEILKPTKTAEINGHS